MKKTLLFILIVGCNLGNILNAQNTGFAGKRILLKTNAINGLYGFCNSYSAEIAFHRKMTITIGYDAINTSVSQSYDPLETVGTNVTINSKAQTSYRGANIEFRKYFSREKPAPYGFFLSTSIANGNLNIEKAIYPEKVFNANGTSKELIYSINGINLTKIAIGLGFQKPILKHCFVGGQLTLNYVKYGNIITGLPQNAASGVLKNYGSNIYSTNWISETKPVGEQLNKSLGISAQIQFGIMLF